MLFIKSLFLVVFSLSFNATSQTIQFSSKDGLKVTADLYLTSNDDAPFIILFHQAGWSRGEYLEIAPRLNELGYNCMAVDQRSGKTVNEVENETAKRAAEKSLAQDYPDALPDMYAAIAYVKENYKYKKLILWGSSYSSALVLKIAGDKPGIADATLSFAPGEYFTRYGKSDDWITQSAKNIKAPVFITSAKDEHAYWKGIFEVIPSENKQSFLPETKGNHGSRALWKQFDDSVDYWKAVEAFLESL
ncbi:alpha/beta hydrolase [Carboxylicivirga sp. N1Y90]|uniref:alpha/beta hydrolase n=1 Tax=Carboxylicivirga fragile TaxID=3417571 RepID=UPI003D3328EC|nr:alpha/beta hydrolase [Marinilabiliaceae bacterium N1Y90]